MSWSTLSATLMTATNARPMLDRSVLKKGAPAGDFARWNTTSHTDIRRRRHSELHRPSRHRTRELGPRLFRGGSRAPTRTACCAASQAEVSSVGRRMRYIQCSHAVPLRLRGPGHLCCCNAIVREPFHGSAWHLHGPLPNCSAALGTVRFLVWHGPSQ